MARTLTLDYDKAAKWIKQRPTNEHYAMGELLNAIEKRELQ